MCEVFGFSGKHRTVLNEELKEFYSHGAENPNGWGLALLGDFLNIEKEPFRADRSRYLKERMRETIHEKNLIAHIRLATIGNEEWSNCHPFAGTDVNGRRWVLVHNGTIFDCPRLDPYIYTQNGTSDSERILLHLLDLVNERSKEAGRDLSPEERFEVLDRMVVSMARGNKLILLIYDGETMYAHSNFRDRLYVRKDENGICLSTRPLSRGRWMPAEFCTLTGFQDGEQVYTGTRHDGEYIADDEAMKSVFMAYSGL